MSISAPYEHISKEKYKKAVVLQRTRNLTLSPGSPTENGAMEAINGWAKEELFTDFNIKEYEDVETAIRKYVYFFNHRRPAYSLNYLTPFQYKQSMGY